MGIVTFIMVFATVGLQSYNLLTINHALRATSVITEYIHLCQLSGASCAPVFHRLNYTQK